MRFAVDIDGTIAYRNISCFVQVASEQLQLGIAETVLQNISTIEMFYALPEVQAYKERVDPQVYEWSLTWIDFDREVLLAMYPIQGAQEALASLSRAGHTIEYYTARYSTDDQRNQVMQEATTAWLTTHSFVNPTSVTFCDGILDKLTKLLQNVAEKGEPVLLIDDQYARLLQKAAEIEPDLVNKSKDNLFLVAYRARTPLAPDAPLQTLVLPSWKEENVQQMLVQKGTHNAD